MVGLLNCGLCIMALHHFRIAIHTVRHLRPYTQLIHLAFLASFHVRCRKVQGFHSKLQKYLTFLSLFFLKQPLILLQVLMGVWGRNVALAIAETLLFRCYNSLFVVSGSYDLFLSICSWINLLLQDEPGPRVLPIIYFIMFVVYAVLPCAYR